MQSGKKIYFASDFHLGIPNHADSLLREKMIVRWLDQVAVDAEEIFLVGDIFDFWFEYKTVVPKGFVRLLGKMAEIADSGIPLHVFTGNHDMWIFDYLPQEVGCTVHRAPIQRTFDNTKFYIGHGDGLGPGDHGYKFIKKVFANKFFQWLFARFHPNLGVGVANYWSRTSRKSGAEKDKVFLGNEKEWLVIYCKEVLQNEYFDHFIFGHRHMPLQIDLGQSSLYTNLGDWISHFTYGEWDGEKMHLKTFS